MIIQCDVCVKHCICRECVCNVSCILERGCKLIKKCKDYTADDERIKILESLREVIRNDK